MNSQLMNILVILCCSVMGLTNAVAVQSCRSVSAPAPTQVLILGCTSAPCQLVRGQTVIGNIDFVAPVATNTLQPKVRFELSAGSGEFELPEEQRNACNHLIDSRCPLDSTEDVTWKLVMPVLEEYPKEVSLTLEISLIGDNNVVQTCFRLDTVVV